MAGPRDYSTGTRAALAALSKGHCYYPGCTVPTIVFVEGEPIVNNQIAHIRDAKPGNRYVEDMSDDERRSFENLVLLCKPHHEWVDKTHPERFQIEDLERWKEDRETGGITELRGLDGLTEERLRELIHDALSTSPTEEMPLDWRLDEEAFEDAVATAFRADDDIALRRFLEQASTEWASLIASDVDSREAALALLDRLTCLAACAVRWDRAVWASRTLNVLEDMYRAVLTDHGSIRPSLVEPGHRLLMAITNRVLGLGAVAVDAEAWQLVVDLAVRRPANLHPIYSNWIRNTTTEAARAGELEWTDSNGRTVRGSYLEVALTDIGRLGCVNREAPDTDGLRTRLAGVDALFTIAVWHHAPGDRDVPYYPWHRAYEADRYEPALVLLLSNDELRGEVFPDSDEDLAQVLLNLERFGRQELAAYDGGWPYLAPEIQAFVAAQRAREEHAELVRSVLRHAQEVEKAVPVSRRGQEPTVVTYSTGEQRSFVSNLEVYKRLVADKKLDPRTATHGRAPRTVRESSTEQLRTWLAD